MDPELRPTAEQLLDHDFFNDFRDWFEDEIQTLLKTEATIYASGSRTGGYKLQPDYSKLAFP